MTRPVSVLFVATPTYGGGVERGFALFLNRADRSVVQPSIALTHSRAETARLLARVPGDVPVLALNKRGFLDQPRALRALARHIEATRPDVVISKATYASVLALAARRLTRHKPQIVVEEHGSPPPVYPLRIKWVYWLARRLYRDVYRLVPPGNGLRTELHAAFDYPIDRMEVIHPAWDSALETSPLRWHGTPAHRVPVVLYVGRLSEEKGVPDLIAAVDIVLRTRPVRLRIVGEGDRHDDLAAQARSLGIADHVEMTGYLAQPFAEMAAADVMVVPSHRDAFPTVVIEGMRVGIPVISTLCDGPREQITDGENGLLVPTRNPRALAGAIARILDHPELAVRLSSAGIAQSDRHSPQRMVAEIQDLVVRAATGAP